MSSTDQSELARDAEAGDPRAQFEYALSILGGDTAAAEGLRAIELIDAASQQGYADATAMCALFEAMGAARPQSWTQALDKLQEAAEGGSESAQGQLLTLSGRGSGKSRRSGSGIDWSRLRATLSVEKLLEPPSRQLLSDSPRIVAFPRFATEAECNWCIARARDGLKRAAVFHTRSGEQTYNAVRDNSCVEFQLPQMDLVLEVLRARIAAATRLPVPIFEPVQVLNYAVGEQFRPHHDFLDPNAPGFAEQIRRFGQRIATVLVYLNDNYTGGNTVFPKIGLSYRGKAGDALFFTNVDRTGRADPLTMHAGAPPTSGEKWVISQWIRDRAPTSPLATGAPAQ